MATILIVDDHASNREVLVALLSQKHTLMEASDGAEGLDRALRERPDLIITDILMPAMDGYEFVRRLREDSATAATPVIFYSAGYLLHEARALAAQCGVEHVITKPCEPEQLLDAVDAALGMRPVAAPLEVQEFDREHIRVLTDKLSQKAEELQAANLRLEALVELGRQLNVADDTAVLLEKYCLGAREIIGAACAAVCITDEKGNEVTRYCAKGDRAECADQHGHPCPLSGSAEAIFSCRAPRRGFLQASEPLPSGCSASAPMSYLAMPIATRKRAYGWLGLINKIGYQEFRSEDERVAGTLAAQLAVTYENAQLFEELKLHAQSLEHELRERRNQTDKYQMILEQASDGIAIADAWGAYLDVNAKLLEMLGYAREELMDLNIRDLIQEAGQAHDPLPFSELHAGSVLRQERRVVRRDGTALEVETSVGRLRDGRIHAIVRDVTERKSLEQQLRQAQKLEAVGRLAGGVAHDFNNLLTVIMGHSHLALGLPDTPKEARCDLEDIAEAATRASVLTGQLLAFSRKQVLQPKRVDVNDSIAKLVKMMARLINANIELVTRLDPMVSSIKVDPVQLDQVILNLAVNSSDAMPMGGKLIIKTENYVPGGKQEVEEMAGQSVMITVKDTGCGMSAETKSHLFEPFYTTKAAGKGTGLGLSTVYGIVRQSNGHISVESILGEGTTFKILFPAAAPAVRPESGIPDNMGLAEGNETVLLVEDEQRVRSLGCIILRQLGYSVLEAANGEEALQVAKEYPGEIHLLFTDLMMPGISGKELADQLVRRRPKIRVLFSSGHADDAVIQQGALAPEIPFLQKPFTPRTLAGKIRAALDSDHGAVNSQQHAPPRPAGLESTDSGVEYTS